MKLFHVVIISLFFAASACIRVNGQSAHSLRLFSENTQKIVDHSQTTSSEATETQVPPRSDAVTKDGTTKVFGYLPDWLYPTQAGYLRFDLLTHLAVFTFFADSLGNLSLPYGWPWTSLITQAHASGVNVIMTVFSNEIDDMRMLMEAGSPSQENLFSKIRQQIAAYNLDGVNIDFEGFESAGDGVLLKDFLEDLSLELKTQIASDIEVSFASPAVNWLNWDMSAIAGACDYLFIMGYDFYGSWSEVSGPTAPYTGGIYNIINTLDVQYGSVIASAPEKLILGVPYYGPRYNTTGNSPGSPVRKFIDYLTYSDVYPYALAHTVQWDGTTQNPYIVYPADTGFIQIWFDNELSLGLKYDAALTRNLGGIGIWALGNDQAHPLWSVIEDKVYAGIDDSAVNPEAFELLQNYPNPFNPETAISFSIPSDGYVSLKIFNSLGQLIEELANGSMQAGSYTFRWNAQQAPSNIYFSKLTFTASGISYSQVRKMMLLK